MVATNKNNSSGSSSSSSGSRKKKSQSVSHCSGSSSRSQDREERLAGKKWNMREETSSFSCHSFVSSLLRLLYTVHLQMLSPTLPLLRLYAREVDV